MPIGGDNQHSVSKKLKRSYICEYICLLRKYGGKHFFELSKNAILTQGRGWHPLMAISVPGLKQLSILVVWLRPNARFNEPKMWPTKMGRWGNDDLWVMQTTYIIYQVGLACWNKYQNMQSTDSFVCQLEVFYGQKEEIMLSFWFPIFK